MKTRKSINVHNSEINFECVKLFVNLKGWEWFITYDEDYWTEDLNNGIYSCFVQSPMCPKGEFGTVYIKEVEEFGTEGDPFEAMPPVGYKWEEK